MAACLDLYLAVQEGSSDIASSAFAVIKQSPPIAPYNWDSYNSIYLRFYPDGNMTMVIHISGSTVMGMIPWAPIAPASTLGIYMKVKIIFQSTSLQVWNNGVSMGTIGAGGGMPTLGGAWRFVVS